MPFVVASIIRFCLTSIKRPFLLTERSLPLMPVAIMAGIKIISPGNTIRAFNCAISSRLPKASATRVESEKVIMQSNAIRLEIVCINNFRFMSLLGCYDIFVGLFCHYDNKLSMWYLWQFALNLTSCCFRMTWSIFLVSVRTLFFV